MTSHAADALVLVFTPGMSLGEWDRLGMLQREWALYSRLAPRYRRVLLVTFGGGEDQPIARRLGADLVCNAGGLDGAAYLASLPSVVGRALPGTTPVVVKTNQLPAGPAAVSIVRALRGLGRPAALVARGGYLHSWFVAYEAGPGSAPARRAGEDELVLCREADVVVGTSQDMLDAMSWRYGLERERLRLVPNYVIADREPTGVSDREPGLVLYAGQLTRRKRVDVLIGAVAGMPDPLRSMVTLRIIGEGPEEARLRAMAAGAQVRCEFLARVPHGELLEHMSRCAVYAQASELEGHPKTVIEAMSTGAPVLVADSPGLGRVVLNGATGVRTVGDARHFTDSLAALLMDHDWRELLGHAAAREVRAELGLERIAALELDVHREALVRATDGPAHGAAAHGAEVRWEPELLNAAPTVAADRWMHSLEAFARRLSDQGRAELISRLEASLRGKNRNSAA